MSFVLLITLSSFALFLISSIYFSARLALSRRLSSSFNNPTLKSSSLSMAWF